MSPLLAALLITAGALYGFVSFTAAIAAEFLGAGPLPKWSRTCVSKRRAASLLGHIAATFVFLTLSVAILVIAVAYLIEALRNGDLAAAFVAGAALGAICAWLLYLRRRYATVAAA